MTNINHFDDDSIERIGATVQRLQAQIHNLNDRLARVTRQNEGKTIRTGVTVANPAGGSNYPTTGCQFWVQFEDWAFLEIDGDCTDLTRKQWATKHVVARTVNETHIPEGSDVLIRKVPGKDGHRWWATPIGSGAAVATSTEIIEFTIVSVNTSVSPRTAVVNIKSRQCSATSVTGEVAGQVTVVDPSGCYLDELPADLVGRWGGASYQLPDGEVTCQWRFIWLCCAPCEPEAQSTQSSASKAQAMITGLGPGPIPGQYVP